jgi:hypothetical protein
MCRTANYLFRAANYFFLARGANQPQPQIQVNQHTSQFNTHDHAENTSQINNSNQCQAPRMTQSASTQNLVPSTTNFHVNKLEQESVNINGFIGLKLSGHSISRSIASPSISPQLTEEIYSQICSAQSQCDLENYMRIVGVSSLQELCEMKFESNYTVLTVAAKTGNAKLISLLFNLVADPQRVGTDDH